MTMFDMLEKESADIRQQLAEENKLRRFWEHQHELDMKLLQDKEQRIATLEANHTAEGTFRCTCNSYPHIPTCGMDDRMVKLEQERDRLQAQLEKAVELLERNGIVREDLFSRTEKEE